MMNNLLDNLITILKEEYNCYCQLNQMALDKKETLINNEVSRLTEILQEDEEVVATLEELEKERAVISGQLAKIYELGTDTAHFSQLTDNIPEPWQTELVTIGEKLISVLGKLQEQNQQNRVLLEQSLKINTFSLNKLIKALEPDKLVYSREGNSAQGSGAAHLVDRKG